MTRMKTGTWVLIADGEKALFLVNEGDDEALNLRVLSKNEHENPPTGVQAANRPGRVGQSATHGRSAYEDTDWHELAKDRFAKDLADKLYAHAHKGHFDHLIICASRNVISTLRDELHQEVSNRVIAEIPKVLTNHPLYEAEEIIKTDLSKG